MIENAMTELRLAAIKMELVRQIQNSIANALEIEQKVDITKIIKSDHEWLFKWLNSDAGRAAIKDFADKFIASK